MILYKNNYQISIKSCPNSYDAEQVLNLSSLQGTYEGNTKKAITVLSEINSTTYEPINEIKLLFTTIFVKKDNAFSYNSASSRL